MENKENIYWVTEQSFLHYDKMNKRLWVVIIILIIALLGTNAGWLYYESQWDTVSTEVTQENDSGYNNYIGNDGDIYNGETEDKNN